MFGLFKNRTCFFCEKKLKNNEYSILEYTHAAGKDKTKICYECAAYIDKERLDEQRDI